MNFSKIILITFLFLSSSCEFLTPKLWKEGYYNDRVEQFLISEDGKKIIFIGTKYHYIFSDDSGNIQKIIKWKNTSKLQILVGDFDIKSNNKIKGDIKLIISKSDLGQNNESFITSLGFKKSEYDSNNPDYVNNIHLAGKRYLPKEGVDYSGGSKLSREYVVRVRYNSFSDIAGKVAKTPLTVANDVVTISVVGGAIALNAVILSPIIVIVFVASVPELIK